MRKILVLFMVVIFCSCTKENTKIDVSTIKVNFQLHRFDQEFYNTQKSLEALKNTYPFLFPKHVHDSIWSQKRQDKDELELFTETQKVYRNFDEIQTELTSLFKHIKYYNPTFRSPKTITMLTNIDYKHRIVYRDSILLISLDAYLGENHKFYADYPAYIKQHNTKEHIVIDVAHHIVNQQILPKQNRTFIDKMIHKGKKMYLVDTYLPNTLAHEKMGYTPQKMNWAMVNEEQIWQYFIEKDIVFSTDRKLDRRFLEIAPFSKFYMEEDNLSPGRIGEWVGWQIVKSFMKNNDVSLHELIRTTEEEIFKKSKYRPRK